LTGWVGEEKAYLEIQNQSRTVLKTYHRIYTLLRLRCCPLHFIPWHHCAYITVVAWWI